MTSEEMKTLETDKNDLEDVRDNCRSEATELVDRIGALHDMAIAYRSAARTAKLNADDLKHVKARRDIVRNRLNEILNLMNDCDA